MSDGPKNLRKLYRYMHEVIIPRHKANGASKRQPEHGNCNRICKVCRKLFFEKTILYDPELKPKPCPECQAELDKGQIALTCLDGRYAFIYSNALAGTPQIQEISKETMDAVDKRAKEIKDGLPKTQPPRAAE